MAERLAKKEQMSLLRTKLTSQQTVEEKIMYYVSLPTEEAHHDCHPTRGCHLMAQKINPNIAVKITELVREGMVDPYEVQKALKHYVNEILCAKTTKPDPDDRAYYPVIRDIRNHIYKAKKAFDLSKFDQENLKMKIESWEKNGNQSKFYFRPFVMSEDEQVDGVDNGLEYKQSLLWVHQSEWQRDILAKYGKTMTMTLMDATYKTTKYDIPLFFLTVRTNAGYMVAAEFIIQVESVSNIEEALHIIKKWNPDWNPPFFMCDYSEAEISSLENVFPNTVVYICDFHREQCWERWVKDQKHGLTRSEGDFLLDILRTCAYAPPVYSPGQDPDFQYCSAVKNLKASQVWQDHEQVQTWLNNYWLPIAKVHIISM